MKNAINNNSVQVTLKSAITVSLLSAGYLLLSAFLVGYKADQLILVLIFNSLFYASSGTRKLF